MESFYNFLGYFYSYPPNVQKDAPVISDKHAPPELFKQIEQFNANNLRKTAVRTAVKPPQPLNFEDNELKRLLGEKFKNVYDV